MIKVRPQPHKIPILLTSSVIAHDTSVRLINSEDRIRFALESISEWLTMDARQPLVLCDGSSFDFSQSVNKLFPEAKIECLAFENDQNLVKEKGRGFGEGEIVRHALHNSRFVSEAGCFAKCSSKLWVNNFRACAELWQGEFLLHGIFLDALTPWRRPRLSYIDTRFYIACRESYARYFENAHQLISQANGIGLENAFLEIFLKENLSNAFSPVAPQIAGVGGSVGKYYKNTARRHIKEQMRLWRAQRTEQFSRYFINE